MLDRSIHLSFATALLLWTIGLSVVVFDLTLPSDDWGHLGLALCCLGLAAHLHGVVLRLGRSRTREAFETGRELGRAEGRRLGPVN